ncbi:hypothetical protein L6452_12644 [Arctium lappa]|uniref:Uncharacterized protein n=1 Tax=Arctium lappa TaxID=4217 RepID=A0ACB9DRN5_ARCLA|nr:hypothetical protein L6452_12644 [Arctium lappa]
MGSTESTGRSNQTAEEEDEGGQLENGSSGGGSGGAGTAIAIVAAGTVLAAWGISKAISGNKDSDTKEKDDAMKIKAHEMGSSSSNFPIHRESVLQQAIGKGPTYISGLLLLGVCSK